MIGMPGGTVTVVGGPPPLDHDESDAARHFCHSMRRRWPLLLRGGAALWARRSDLRALGVDQTGELSVAGDDIPLAPALPRRALLSRRYAGSVKVRPTL